jgi:arylsulfatase A-like enzyme
MAWGGKHERGFNATAYVCTFRAMKLPRLAAPALMLASLWFASAACAAQAAKSRPNIVVILTDDQGFGDLSIQGNPVLETPNIDALARSGATMKSFYVSPVCSPTRASLLTGRYNYRTRVVDTFKGRSCDRPQAEFEQRCLPGDA